MFVQMYACIYIWIYECIDVLMYIYVNIYAMRPSTKPTYFAQSQNANTTFKAYVYMPCTNMFYSFKCMSIYETFSKLACTCIWSMLDWAVKLCFMFCVFLSLMVDSPYSTCNRHLLILMAMNAYEMNDFNRYIGVLIIEVGAYL